MRLVMVSKKNNPLVVCGWDRKYVASYESQTMGEGFSYNTTYCNGRLRIPSFLCGSEI